jgi:D-serine deaminase-like pyridoxal phosphate-dependent protein
MHPNPGSLKSTLPTPCLLVDLPMMEANLDGMAAFYRERPQKLRPHYKTHKCPQIAKMQLEMGAIGITCAKLGEAETLVEAGLTGILIANQVVDPRKIERLAELAAQVEMLVAVDQTENLHQLSQAAVQVGSAIHILVEVDVGLHRCGVRTQEQARELARIAAVLPGLHFAGVMGYEGHTVFELDRERRSENVQQSMGKLTAAAELIRLNGLPVEIVSAGGTGTFDLTGSFPGVTEVQAGSYSFMDAKYRQLELSFQPALSLLATVISTPEPGLAIIDAGMKAITSDNGLPEVIAPEGVKLLRLNEEHGILQVEERTELRVGERVELLPSHVCTTVNLHDWYYVMKEGALMDSWRIEGRGKFQ